MLRSGSLHFGESHRLLVRLVKVEGVAVGPSPTGPTLFLQPHGLTDCPYIDAVPS